MSTFATGRASRGAARSSACSPSTACGSTKDDEETSSRARARGRPSGKAAAGAEIKKGLKIAFLPKQVNNPYFTISDKGGVDAVKALGGEAKEVGPSDASASSQVSYINTLTTQKRRRDRHLAPTTRTRSCRR